MLGSIRSWIVSILLAAFIVNIVNMILPSSKIKPYINLVLNFLFVFIAITPIINFLSEDMTLEDRLLKVYKEYNESYVDSVNKLSKDTGKDSLKVGYEGGLKDILKLKLEEYGYELSDIEFDGSDIGKIKLKDKNNSNKDLEVDIQSNKSENDTQVFNDKSNDVKKEELKEDLVKILDISIESIEID